MPTTAHDCRLLNDQAEEQVIATSPASGEMTVPLDPLRQLSVVKIRYSSTAQPSRHWPITRIITPIPQPSLPVLGRQWAVSSCAGFGTPAISRRLANPAHCADRARRRPLQITPIRHFFFTRTRACRPALAVRLCLFQSRLVNRRSIQHFQDARCAAGFASRFGGKACCLSPRIDRRLGILSGACRGCHGPSARQNAALAGDERRNLWLSQLAFRRRWAGCPRGFAWE